MSKRKTADGKVIYTYVCKMKERSQRSVCNSKNANGNTLDMAVIEQIKMLAEDRDTSLHSWNRAADFIPATAWTMNSDWMICERKRQIQRRKSILW